MEAEENYGSLMHLSTLTSSSKDESELRGARSTCQAHSAGFFHLLWPHPEGPVEVQPKSPQSQDMDSFATDAEGLGSDWCLLALVPGAEEGMVRPAMKC